MRTLLIAPPGPWPARKATGVDAVIFDACGPHPPPSPWDGPPLWPRVGPDGAGLERALALRPGGLVLAPASPRALAALGVRLAVHEAEAGLPPAGLRILVLAASARVVADLGALAAASPRLAGFAFGGAELARDLGLPAALTPTGAWVPALEQARSLLCLAAAAAGLPAYDEALLEGDAAPAAGPAPPGFDGLLLRADPGCGGLASRAFDAPA